MSAADIALLALGAYFVVRGFMRGLTGEAFSLAGIIGSFYCSMTYSTPLARLLSAKWGLNPLVSATISIVAIFLGVLILCAVLNMQVKKLLKATDLSRTNTVLGGLSGVLKTLLVVLAVLVVAIVVSPLTGNAWVRGSKVLMGAAHILPVVYPPLEERGYVPNIEKLRQDTVNFVMTRTMSALTGAADAEEDEIASGDLAASEESEGAEETERPEAPYDAEPAQKTEIAGGDAKRLKSLEALIGRLSPMPDRTKPKDQSYRRKVLDYFIGPDAEWKGDGE